MEGKPTSQPERLNSGVDYTGRTPAVNITSNGTAGFGPRATDQTFATGPLVEASCMGIASERSGTLAPLSAHAGRCCAIRQRKVDSFVMAQRHKPLFVEHVTAIIH